MQSKIQRALISVSEKSGVAEFARGLSSRQVEILSTGGTYAALSAAGVPARDILEYTGFPEIMDGRVKTLHPKVHGGILSVRDQPSHRSAMDEHAIRSIDLVVVNLYPFEAAIQDPKVRREAAIEEIDVGGPAMIRAAAKNHRFVGVVTDPSDYGRVLEEMDRNDGVLSESLRRDLAIKAFSLTARYDGAICRWLAREEGRDGLNKSLFPPAYALAGTKAFDLRYGENPHQAAAFYRSGGAPEPSVATAKVLSGKELSFNNLVDLDAALALAKEFEEPFAAVVKHNNPCGAASAETIERALEDAWAGDPVSAFGSVLSVNRPVNLACARFLTEPNRFIEAIAAPSFDAEALQLLLHKPKWGMNVRLLACGPLGPRSRRIEDWEVRHLVGGFLVQERDLAAESDGDVKSVTKTEATAEQRKELFFAARVAKHVKSNAIVIAHGARVLGVGAGQMSRVDAVRLAVHKAGDAARGAVLASDAFFPFPDGVEVAIDAGVNAILQPGGSMRDTEVIAACDRRGASMLFSGRRHFRH